MSSRAASWLITVCLASAIWACATDELGNAPRKHRPGTRRVGPTVRDAAVKLPLPDNTANMGFSLPASTRAEADRGVSVADRGKGKPIDLSLRFKAGDRQTLDYLLNAKVGDTKARSTMRYDLRVVEVDGKGRAVLELKFDEVTMESSPDKARAKAMADVAAKISGQTVTAILQPDGKVEVVKIHPELSRLMAKLKLDPKQIFGQLYPRFPRGKLGVKAKWLTQLRTKRDGVTETVDLTYELASAVDSPRGLTITVELVGKLTVRGPSGKGSGGLRGQLVLIPSRGRILKAAVSQDLRIRVRGGHTVKMTLLVDVVDKSGD